MKNSYTKQTVDRLRGQLEDKFLFGLGPFLDYLMVAYLARGHVLIEGPPGTGKTLTAKLLATLLSKSFKRIQFTSDLLPGDILGAHIFSPQKQEFLFIKGPIFADFIVADEINRTPPRTQSALLEAMEERQVTIEGRAFPLSADFFVVATQNPRDFEGTFALPEVQLDRFLFKLVVEPGEVETEVKLLRQILNGELPPRFDELAALELDRKRVDEEMKAVRIDDSILKYIAELLSHTRRHGMLLSGSSIRGGIGLARTSRLLALLQGRDYVTPDDVKTLAMVTLRHRIRLNPEAQISRLSEEDVLKEVLEQTEFPA